MLRYCFFQLVDVIPWGQSVLNVKPMVVSARANPWLLDVVVTNVRQELIILHSLDAQVSENYGDFIYR